jgi:signal transduction histidine kinase
MSAVITTLLDLARDQAPDSRRRTCTVADLVPALVAAAGDGVKVDDRTAASTASVAAPRDLVVRAIVPLVDNAVHHADSRVTLTARDLPGSVELSVADDGPGIPAALREAVFEPGTTMREGGSGLGLGIARRVARSFGGEVSLAESTEGACFVVSMPRR